jgi:two-component system chemotaxis response regulator CheY
VGKRALVVDDSSTVRKLVGRMLQQIGLEIVEAANGKEGLERLQGGAFQLIITDLNMPVMDGLEFIRAVRADPNHKATPIIFLTTESEADKKNEAHAAGATGWVVKPFQAEKILNIVRPLLAST